MPRSTSVRRNPESHCTAASGDRVRNSRVSVVQSAHPNSEACEAAELEASLLDFDPNDDLEALVPMPPAISAGVRRTLTATFARRFVRYRDLDAWLHTPHPALGGDTPFERIVDGDGISVLRALLASHSQGWHRRPLRIAQPRLTVIR